jgi:hypothetical protein
MTPILASLGVFKLLPHSAADDSEAQNQHHPSSRFGNYWRPTDFAWARFARSWHSWDEQ